MIDEKARIWGALLLRRLASGRITNDEFDEAYPEGSPDRGVRSVWEFGYSLYSDYYTYRLLGRHALGAEARRIVARCVLFLHSGLEYTWPEPPAVQLWPALRQVLTLGLWRSGYAQALNAWQQSVDAAVWPFASRAELRRAATHPPFFATKSVVAAG